MVTNVPDWLRARALGHNSFQPPPVNGDEKGLFPERSGERRIYGKQFGGESFFVCLLSQPGRREPPTGPCRQPALGRARSPASRGALLGSPNSSHSAEVTRASVTYGCPNQGRPTLCDPQNSILLPLPWDPGGPVHAVSRSGRLARALPSVLPITGLQTSGEPHNPPSPFPGRLPEPGPPRVARQGCAGAAAGISRCL